MKKIVFVVALLTIFCVESGAQKVKLIPVTTSSEKALDLYNKAMSNLMDVNFPDFRKYLDEALMADPDFFMAHYQSAMTSSDDQIFNKSANAAISSTTKLSRGEQLLKEALAKLLTDKKADVSEYGKKLVSMYPQDMNSYLYLLTFQGLRNDTAAMIETINKSLEIEGRKDFMYNFLAYVYMGEEKFEEAGKCLDKYVELSPNLANPYDSKGDLYMLTKEYDKAYMSFMKSNRIDSTFSREKMLKAKSLADDMVIIGEVSEIMKTLTRGLNELNADMAFKNTDKEHFIMFVSNGAVSDDLDKTMNEYKSAWSNFKSSKVVFTSEDYKVLSPTIVLFTGNVDQELSGIKEEQMKIKGAITIIFQKAGGHWNASYVHQSYSPEE